MMPCYGFRVWPAFVDVMVAKGDDSAMYDWTPMGLDPTVLLALVRAMACPARDRTVPGALRPDSVRVAIWASCCWVGVYYFVLTCCTPCIDNA